jgi:signal transduction histidine kinase
VAHAIRNPLSTIKSSAQLLERIPLPEDQRREVLAGVVREVGRIDRTLRDVEAYLELTRRPLQSTRVAAAASSVVASMATTSAESGVELTVNGPDSMDVLMARPHLESALTELVANAIAASVSGATVSIHWRSADGHVVVEVADDGPGIPSDYGDRVLAPFFSTSVEHTGLGLSRVRRLCRLAGGDFEWRNRPDGGATFTLILREA